MQDVVAGLLLLLDVLLLALVVCLVVRAIARAALRYRRRDRVRRYTVRRCDNCRLAWQGEQDVDYGRVELLLRRRERRRARAHARQARGWAKARGWRRCPSCLSTRVRTSGEEVSVEEANSRLSLEAFGYLVSAAGLALLVVAGLGFAARS